LLFYRNFSTLYEKYLTFFGNLAGAPGPAGQKTGPVPGRAGQAVGTFPPPTAQPIRLCGRGGRGCRKTYGKKRVMIDCLWKKKLHDRQFIEKKRRNLSYRKFLQFYQKFRSFPGKKKTPA
jgi:hypothetical protein